MTAARILVISVAVLAGAAEAASAGPAPSGPGQHGRLELRTDGDPSGLRFVGGAFGFCDKRGGHVVDLATGAVRPEARDCGVAAEANTACDGVPGDVVVEAPQTVPNDRLDIGGWTVPLEGRVQDCAGDAAAIVAATAAEVRLVVIARHATRVVDKHGADRVAIGPDAVAWARGSRIVVIPRGDLGR